MQDRKVIMIIGLLSTIFILATIFGYIYFLINPSDFQNKNYVGEIKDTKASEEQAKIIDGQNQNKIDTKDIVTCIQKIETQDPNKYSLLKEKYTAAHPEYKPDSIYIYSYCPMKNGSQLVSISFFKNYSGKWEGLTKDTAGQSLALFDKDNNLHMETKDFFQRTLGDLVPPEIESVDSKKAIFSFSSGDAGFFTKQTYELNLEDFSYILIEKISNEGDVPDLPTSGEYYSWNIKTKGETGMRAPLSEVRLVIKYPPTFDDSKEIYLGTYDGNGCETNKKDGSYMNNLLPNELTGVQCWWGGGAWEVGIFLENGKVVAKLGGIEEATASNSPFRGNFKIIKEIK